MTLRTRLAVVCGAAVALALMTASILVYAAVRQQLRGGVDDDLRERRAQIAHAVDLVPGAAVITDRGPLRQVLLRLPDDRLASATGYVQITPEIGQPIAETTRLQLPRTDDARAVAAGDRTEFLTDAWVGRARVRMLVASLAPGIAVQIAQPLSDVDRALDRLLLVLLFVLIAGTLAGALLARLAADRILAPVSRLTETAERVAATRDLSERIGVATPDELGRLAEAFNAMLGALDDSVSAQRRLVADASHELRTPIATVRTNLDVLSRARDLAPDERERLLDDVRGQLAELSSLVTDIVDLARENQPDLLATDVRLDRLVGGAVARARRLWPGLSFEEALTPCVVVGTSERLDRAVGNLLDNAAKWSPEGGRIEVALRDGLLTVRDHGPGIDEDDLPRVFERFYRATAARGLPGSGLGLAIVQQVTEAHGGHVSAANAPGGGALLSLRLPAITI